MDPSVGNLNRILAGVGENLNNDFQKSQKPGGMLKLRFDRYIMSEYLQGYETKSSEQHTKSIHSIGH